MHVAQESEGIVHGIRKNSGKRGTTWSAVVEGHRDALTGSRNQIKRTFRTQREAKDWRTKTLHELRTGVYAEYTTASVSEYLEQWLEAIRASVRPATLDRYQRIVRNNLVPLLGGIPLAKLAPGHVQELHAHYLSQGLSPSTVSLYHGVLHKALNQAINWQLIGRNVCDAVDKPRRTSPEMTTWEVDQVRIFLAATTSDRLAALWRLAVSTGMRRGELIALRWSDINLERGEIAVRRTVTRGSAGIVFGDPKTAKGIRSVSIPESCVQALRRHRAEQSERRLRIGSMWNATDLVFERGNGEVLHPNIVSHRFKDMVSRLELPRIRFHDLRHTAATLMLANGEHPKIVQERLGHSDIAMTMNLYSHVTPGMQRAAADRLDALIGS